MIKVKYIPVLVVVLAISCRSETASTLDRVEALLSDRPDSALALIESIPREELKTNRTMAHYALLKSWALDKNYIDVASDSLTRRAVDYYSVHGDRKYRMLAWYYHALVQKNAQSYTAAIISLEEAEKEALALNDDYQLGLIMRNKGSIFHSTNNIPGAIASYKQAVDYFSKAEKPLYRVYAELSLAASYNENLDFEKTDSLLERIRDARIQLISEDYFNLLQASSLVNRETGLDKAIELFRKVPVHRYSLHSYGYLALAFEWTDQPDSSDYYLAKGYETCENDAETATLDYMKSRIELHRGYYQAAFHLVDHAITVQDSLTRVLLQQSISSAQRDYYRSEARWREEKIRGIRVKTIFGALLGCLLVSILTMSIVSRSRRKDRQLQDQMVRLSLQEQQLERMNRDNAHLVGSLFSEKIYHLDKLADSYFRMDNDEQKDRVFAQIKQLVSTIRNDDDLFLSLEKDLNRYCDGIMSKLREQVPRIKGENLRMIMLFFAGFSYETVMVILNKNSIESLKMARSRFRKEIRNANAPDADFFIKMLEMT
ncbi:MAG: hypothetical protein J6T22_12540 [Bacteroidales bacterium]|nr:hypothetical protein [Bacteroidales bacterium]